MIEIGASVCSACADYRSNLRAMHSRFRKRATEVHPKTNIRYMNSHQKRARLLMAKAALRNKQRQLSRMKAKLKELTKKEGVEITDDLSQDLSGVMSDYGKEIKRLPANDFKRILWEQQVSYLSCTLHAGTKVRFIQVSAERAKKCGRRWHPLFIRWCLNIALTSSKTYNIMRESGFIILPSKRTLRDYTHYFKSKPGFQWEVDAMLREESQVDKIEDWKRQAKLYY